MDEESKYSVRNEGPVQDQIIGDHNQITKNYYSGSTTVAQPVSLERAWNVPYPRNPYFTGREEIIEHLHEQLCTGQVTASPQAISGLGGVGKTQIAVEYAYRYSEKYYYVLWVRAENQEDLISSYVNLANVLQLPEHETNEAQVIVKAVKHWFETHQHWLLIVDNADDLSLLPPLLPTTPLGHTILTTRATALGRLARRVIIETFSVEQGALFLLQRAGLLSQNASLNLASPEEIEHAKQLAETLGGLPLALDQAGAYLEETGTDLATYQRYYQQHHVQLLSRRGGVVPDHPDSVATTWSLSFEQVKQRNPAAADLLQGCAFLAPDAIPVELFSQSSVYKETALAQIAGDNFLLDEAIEALRSYSLVQRDARTQTLSLHRLIQTVLQDVMNEQERQKWLQYVLVALNVVFPKISHKTWMQCERLLPHILHCVGNHSEMPENPALMKALQNAAEYLEARAQYSQAKPLYEQALHIGETVFGPNHFKIISPLNNLAHLYTELGKYNEAESLYEQALHIGEAVLGKNHPEVTPLLSNLALLYLEQQKDEAAELLLKRALYIREATLGPEHPDVAYSLQGLASLYLKQGMLNKAEPLLQRALLIRETALGSEHPDVAHTLQEMANLYFDQSRYEKAEQLYKQALLIRETTLGSEHPDVAYSLLGLANLYHEQKKYTEAEALLQRALHIREVTLGHVYPQTAFPFNNLAKLYYEQGMYEQAKPLYEQALHIWEMTLGAESPMVAYPLHGLANLYYAQGMYEQAERLYKRVLDIREAALGAKHPLIAYTLASLANIYDEQGKTTKATQLLKRALHILEVALGSEHPHTMNMRVTLMENMQKRKKRRSKKAQ